MKNKILVFVLLAFAFSMQSQRDEAFVNEEVKKFSEALMNRDIQTFFYTQRLCNGSIEIINMGEGKICATKGTYVETYFFWKEDEQLMFKKIDNCGLFYSVPIEDSIWQFVKSKWSAIKSQRVAPYESSNITNTPSQRTTIHPCKRYFKFNDPERGATITYKLFDLTSNEENPNIHYKKNNELAIVKLDKMIDSLLLKYESRLKRQK